MGGGRTLPSMLEKRLMIFFLCCYEHYGMSVRQEEWDGTKGHCGGRVSKFTLMGSWSSYGVN
jgi:hypothetical protein